MSRQEIFDALNEDYPIETDISSNPIGLFETHQTTPTVNTVPMTTPTVDIALPTTPLTVDTVPPTTTPIDGE